MSPGCVPALNFEAATSDEFNIHTDKWPEVKSHLSSEETNKEWVTTSASYDTGIAS